VRIVIVEDQSIIRELLRKVCTQELGFDVVAEAADGQQGVAAILRTAPDLVLLDLELPSVDGFTVIEMIRTSGMKPRILVFSSFYDEYSVYRIERAKVHGFMDKNFNNIRAVAAAIQAVGRGEAYFSAAFAKMKMARHADPQSFDKVLTDREIVVLSLIGDLLSDTEIGEKLDMADRTAQKHRFNIMGKLAIGSRAELERYARKHGFRQSVVRDQPPPGM